MKSPRDRLRFFPLLFAFLFLPLTAKAQSPDIATRISQLMMDADAYAEKSIEVDKALEKYLEILSLDSLQYDALWKASRSYVTMGERLPTSTDEQKERKLYLYEEAVRYADKAIIVNSDGAMGYIRRAAAKSLVALFKNIWKFSSLMNDVREDCEKAIELNSQNSEAHHLLGRAHLKLSERSKIFRWPFGVAWGNKDDAIRLFEKAISLNPNIIAYHIDAARAYLEKKEYEKAQEHLSAVPSLPALTGEDEQLRKEASDLLEQIKEKKKWD